MAAALAPSAMEIVNPSLHGGAGQRSGVLGDLLEQSTVDLEEATAGLLFSRSLRERMHESSSWRRTRAKSAREKGGAT